MEKQNCRVSFTGINKAPSKKTWSRFVALAFATSIMSGCSNSSSFTQMANDFLGTDVFEKSDEQPVKTYPSLKSMGLQPILLRFQANVGNERFSCRRSFANVGKSNDFIRFTDLRFYLSEIMVIRKDGTKVPVALLQDSWQSGNVALLDFEDKTGACVQDGTPGYRTFVIGAVPLGDYQGVTFRIGVPMYYRLPGMPFIPKSPTVNQDDVKNPVQVSSVQTVSRTFDDKQAMITMQKPSRVRGGEVKNTTTGKRGQSASDALTENSDENQKTPSQTSQKEQPSITTEKTMETLEILPVEKENTETKLKTEDKAQNSSPAKPDDVHQKEESSPSNMQKDQKSKEMNKPVLPTKEDYFTYPSKTKSQQGMVAMDNMPQSKAEKEQSPKIHVEKFTTDMLYPSGQPESKRISATALPKLPELKTKNKPKNPREEAMMRANLGLDMFRLQDMDGKQFVYSDTNMPYVLQAHSTFGDKVKHNMFAGGVTGAAMGVTVVGGVAAGAMYALNSSTYRWQPMNQSEMSKVSISGDYPPAPMNVAKLYTRTGVGYAHLRVGMRATNLSQRELSEELAFNMGQGQCDYGEDSSLACKRDNRPLVELNGFDPKRDIIHFDMLSMLYDMILPAQNKPFEQNCNSEVDDYNCDKMFLNFGLNIETGDPLTEYRQDVFSYR